MGREQRRSQERAERRQKMREAAQPRRSQMTMSAPAAAGVERTGFSPRRWFSDIVSELKKVTWPSRREVVNLTIVVVVIALALGLVMGAADLFFGWVVEQTILR